MAHFWPCRVSSRGASGCRTCVHPGKRIGRVPSSFPSVWSSGCPPAWCTCIFPLQRSTMSFITYQKFMRPPRTLFSYPCGSFRSHIQLTTETNGSVYEPVHFSSSWGEWRFTDKHSFMRLWAVSHEDLNSCVCDNNRRQHIQPWNNLSLTL